jgi:hypothetical protein
MSKLRIGVLGGLTALLGFASAVHAETTISLIWQATGNNVVINPDTSNDLVLDVLLNGDSSGTLGGGITVDYGNTGKVSVVGITSNPDAAFATTNGITTDTGSQVRNINGLNPFGPVAINSSVRLGTITFHKKATAGSVYLTTLYTASDGIDGLTLPSSFGSAQLLNIASDDCTIDKKCSVGGSAPQDSCTADPGQEVTYTYDFITGCGLVIDDKLGVIGEYTGQSLSRTTTLAETTTNVAYFELSGCVCITGNTSDSVTVTVTTPTGCAAVWPPTEIFTTAKGQNPANNAKVSHAISGNVIDPTSLSDTADRIEVCAGTAVSSLVTDTTGTPTNAARGSLGCDSTGCSGVVNATEKYQSVSDDGKDKDSITFVPR